MSLHAVAVAALVVYAMNTVSGSVYTSASKPKVDWRRPGIYTALVGGILALVVVVWTVFG